MTRDVTVRAATAGVILAGGQSRRMGGGDKCLLALGKRSLLAHVIARLAPQVEALALNANGDAARFSKFGLPILPDSIADWPGPLAGVLAGLEWAADRGFRRIVTVAADTPFFPKDLVERLAASSAAPVALAESAGGGVHPVFGLWRVDLAPQLHRDILGGARRVRAWAEAQGAVTVPFDCPEGTDPFFNINTPADLAVARSLIT
jgi:molybdenum cofactor guanylyltransferase